MASSCPSRKIQYASQLEARAKILWLWKKRPANSAKIERQEYMCPRCGMWHLTSRPRT